MNVRDIRCKLGDLLGDSLTDCKGGNHKVCAIIITMNRKAFTRFQADNLILSGMPLRARIDVMISLRVLLSISYLQGIQYHSFS